jgi:hypothetical protein
MTGRLTFDDCQPDWMAADSPPGDHTPGPVDLRQHEMHDLRDQGARLHALWTATTVPTGSYL